MQVEASISEGMISEIGARVLVAMERFQGAILYEIKRSALVALQSLQGKKPEDMTKDERTLYDKAIGQLLGVLDVEGKVKI